MMPIGARLVGHLLPAPALNVVALLLIATSLRCGALTAVLYPLPGTLCESGGKTLSASRGTSHTFLEIVPASISPMTFRCSRVVFYDGDRVVRECIKMGPVGRILVGVVGAFEIFSGSMVIDSRRADKIVLDTVAGSIILADGVLAAALTVFLKTKIYPSENRVGVAINRYPDACPNDLVVEIDERKIPVSPLGHIDSTDEMRLADHMVLRGGTFAFRFGTNVVVVRPSPKERCAWAKKYFPKAKNESACAEAPVGEPAVTKTPPPTAPTVSIPAVLIDVGKLQAIIPIPNPIPIVVPPPPPKKP